MEIGATRGAGAGLSPTVSGKRLTEEQERVVRELKQRDAEVKTHEQAHKTVGGPYAGAIRYEYTTGPDGRKYAVGGEVPIDVSPEKDPEATIRKMEVVKRAALAPAEPSPADRQVAAQADAQKAQAQAELNREKSPQAEPNRERSPLAAYARAGADPSSTFSLIA